MKRQVFNHLKPLSQIRVNLLENNLLKQMNESIKTKIIEKYLNYNKIYFRTTYRRFEKTIAKLSAKEWCLDYRYQPLVGNTGSSIGDTRAVGGTATSLCLSQNGSQTAAQTKTSIGW